MAGGGLRPGQAEEGDSWQGLPVCVSIKGDVGATILRRISR